MDLKELKLQFSKLMKKQNLTEEQGIKLGNMWDDITTHIKKSKDIKKLEKYHDYNLELQPIVNFLTSSPEIVQIVHLTDHQKQDLSFIYKKVHTTHIKLLEDILNLID